MISRCDKSDRLVCHWSSYHIFTSLLIYNWTDTRKNEFFWVMYTFYKVKPCAALKNALHICYDLKSASFCRLISENDNNSWSWNKTACFSQVLGNGYSKIVVVVVVVNFQKSFISLERFFQHLTAGLTRSPSNKIVGVLFEEEKRIPGFQRHCDSF